MNETSSATEKLATPGPYSVGRVRKFFAELGPGLITGAADDDFGWATAAIITFAAIGMFMTM